MTATVPAKLCISGTVSGAPVAHSVEQRTFNPRVRRSKLRGGTTSPTIFELPARLRAKIRLELPPADPCASPVPGLCWTWTASVNNRGYAYTTFGRGNRWLVHRWTYTQFIGPIPDGLEIDHLCRNTRCCNPLHLEAVTTKVNQERGVKRQATHCQRGHEFAGHNLMIRKSNSTRECRACKYESTRRSLARRQAAGLPAGHRLHGTITGYMAYARSCDRCRAAGAEAWQRNSHSSRGKKLAAEQVAA